VSYPDDADAEVTESRMLVHRSTGREAEVDVCIEGTVGGERVIVSVECTDRARRADVGWIDAMHGKHDSLPTNQLVLASRSGFTKEALIKANARGILTVSLQEERSAKKEAGLLIERIREPLPTCRLANTNQGGSALNASDVHYAQGAQALTGRVRGDIGPGKEGWGDTRS
jgi:hypothetical protein